jgi:hypothetical protein
MPAFPFASLDDVEGANQRSFANNVQFITQNAQRAADAQTFISTQSQQLFLQGQQIQSALALQLATNVNNPVANNVLSDNLVKGEPREVSPPVVVFPPSTPAAPAQTPKV